MVDEEEEEEEEEESISKSLLAFYSQLGAAGKNTISVFIKAFQLAFIWEFLLSLLLH